jgi:hypothetical protein
LLTSTAPYGYGPQCEPDDSRHLATFTPTPLRDQACNYHMKGSCNQPGSECSRSHDKVICQPQATKDVAALLHGPYGIRGALECLAKGGIHIEKPLPIEPRAPASSAPYTNRTMYGSNRGLQPPLRPLGPAPPPTPHMLREASQRGHPRPFTMLTNLMRREQRPNLGGGPSPFQWSMETPTLSSERLIISIKRTKSTNYNALQSKYIYYLT